MRQSWTDDRLDDFRRDVDRRFDRVDCRFDALERRFDSLQRTLLQLGGGVIVALIGLIATQL